ncbi:predicted protein [Verticillium alfalfae VaMs.102]|uniref:Predicted protein n=1 Tax=Verticillium alfalfae (strain VaMs.102 / ATCC MYA-4576 / FGSC 10136) TaxID=526221 RepID=C9SWQ8_VERA1|nr:predicted protein [Verticillium alfalfae VaMs.102]EEY23449.1 predicted protein [Verticillium alfalfae VaMs.102]
MASGGGELTIFVQNIADLYFYTHPLMFGTPMIFCVVFKSFPCTDGPKCLVIRALCGLLINLIQPPLEICESAFEMKKISSAESIKFTENKRLVVWYGGNPSCQGRKAFSLRHVFDIHEIRSKSHSKLYKALKSGALHLMANSCSGHVQHDEESKSMEMKGGNSETKITGHTHDAMHRAYALWPVAWQSAGE